MIDVLEKVLYDEVNEKGFTRDWAYPGPFYFLFSFLFKRQTSQTPAPATFRPGSKSGR